MDKKPVVISMINLKGGVGKTTITLALADFISNILLKKVLVIDMDPQCNASMAFLGETRWLEKEEKKETLYHLFKDCINNRNTFSIQKAVEVNVSNINQRGSVINLLPSSLGLIYFQDFIPIVENNTLKLSNCRILKQKLKSVIKEYDYVLIDCPPNLGILSLNALFMSDYYIIPVIPDHLSTLGIPSILNRLNFISKRATDFKVKPLGVLISMYRTATKLHNQKSQQLYEMSFSRKIPYVFDTKIPLSIDFAEAVQVRSFSTLRQKYGSHFSIFTQLLEEIEKHIKNLNFGVYGRV